MKKILFAILSLFILTGCATKTKIEKGDTIYDTKYVEKTKYRDRIVYQCDTCWRDSVATEYKETVKEVVKIPKIYKLSLWFTILSIIFVIVKLYHKFKV